MKVIRVHTFPYDLLTWYTQGYVSWKSGKVLQEKTRDKAPRESGNKKPSKLGQAWKSLFEVTLSFISVPSDLKNLERHSHGCYNSSPQKICVINETC